MGEACSAHDCLRTGVLVALGPHLRRASPLLSRFGGVAGTAGRAAAACDELRARARLETLLVCLQTPPGEQPQPALAASANATFADAVQVGLAQMLTALDAAGIHERPPQVRHFRKQQQSV